MCKVTFVGPVLTGGVPVPETIGICIEFCTVAEVGRIKPPPAKALASKNYRRNKRLSSCLVWAEAKSQSQLRLC